MRNYLRIPPFFPSGLVKLAGHSPSDFFPPTFVPNCTPPPFCKILRLTGESMPPQVMGWFGVLNRQGFSRTNPGLVHFNHHHPDFLHHGRNNFLKHETNATFLPMYIKITFFLRVETFPKTKKHFGLFRPNYRAVLFPCFKAAAALRELGSGYHATVRSESHSTWTRSCTCCCDDDSPTLS